MMAPTPTLRRFIVEVEQRVLHKVEVQAETATCALADVDRRLRDTQSLLQGRYRTQGAYLKEADDA